MVRPSKYDPRPNIVLIMSDQHTPGMLGCYGHTGVHTPELDRLAAEGLRCRAYCNNPVCVPSRMSMLTGTHSHRINVWCNAQALAPHWATWPLLLRLAGYATVISGRNHMLWGDRLYGFGRRLCGDDGRRIPFVHPGRTTVGQNKRPQGSGSAAGAQSRTAHADHDETAVSCAERYIAQAPEEPFALFVGLYQPHAPFIARSEYVSLYDHPLWKEHVAGYTGDPLPHYEPFRCEQDLDPEWLEASARGYAGMVSHVDALVGRIRQALELRGALENTLLLYTSDHGEMLGRHGLWHKMVFYEDSVRVPLIMRGPMCPGPGRVLPINVSLLDLFPTLLDVAGYRTDLPLDGRSLVSWMQGTGPAGWDDTVMAESLGAERGRPGRMLKRGHLKLIRYYRREPVLFDLEKDPRETRNVAADPAYRDILASLQSDLEQGWDPEAVNRGVDESLRHIYYHHAASGTGNDRDKDKR